MILVNLKLSETQKERLRSAASGQEMKFVPRNAMTSQQLEQAEVIIGNIPVDRLGECHSLKWIHLNNAGADDFAHSEKLGKEVILTNSTGAYGTVIAEHALAMMLELMKHLQLYYRHQWKQEWVSESSPFILEGKTVLILGTGDLGSSVAKKLQMLGCRTIGVKRRAVSELPFFHEVHTSDELDALLPAADVLIAALPQTEGTISMINGRRLRLMKRGAYLVNIGRGSAVDTDALTEALRRKELAGAALDVTCPEPLPKGHPLWTMDNVVITPHISGNYNVPETLERIVEIAEENLRRFYGGRPLLNQVDRKTGYCI